MNPSPRLRYRGFDGDPTHNPGCGIIALDNDERARNQSAFQLPEPAVSIYALAWMIRKTYHHAPENMR